MTDFHGSAKVLFHNMHIRNPWIFFYISFAGYYLNLLRAAIVFNECLADCVAFFFI